MHRARTNRRALLAVLALLFAGCATPASETPSASESAIPSVATGANCQPIELRLPSGQRVDLTGTWRGTELVHHVRQIGDCVWWIAYSDKPDQPLGALYTISFLGHLSQDFSITCDWAGIVRLDDPSAHYPPSPTEGPVEFDLVIDPDTAEITLVQRGVAPPDSRDYPADVLRFIGPLPEPQIP